MSSLPDNFPASGALEPLLPWLELWLEGRESAPPDCGVEILKLSALRLVLRLPDPERGRVVLKLYRRKGVVEAIRSLWLRSRSARERRILEEARRRRIPCPEVLGAGHDAGAMPRLGWLLLQDLGEGESLDRIHEDRGLTPPELESCADLLRQAWAMGLRHRDLHLGNFYRRAHGEPCLLDLHSARFVAPAGSGPFVPPRPSALRPLYLSFPWPEQDTQRRALFARLELPSDPPRLPAWRVGWLRRRLQRCLRDSGSFYWRDSLGQGRDTGYTTHDLIQAIDSAEILKQGRRGAVLRSGLGIHKIRRSGRSLQLWLAAEALALRDIPHPKALAWIPLDGGRGSVLSQDLGEARSLEGPTAQQAPRLARDLGRSFGRLHGSGWRFRDARGDNFLITGDRVHFVDLDGCSPLPALRPRAAATADLGRLLAWLHHQAPTHLRADADRLGRIFLQNYLRQRRRLDGEPRSLRSFCRRIALRSETWRRSHQDSGTVSH